MPWKVYPPGTRGFATWSVRGTDASGRVNRATGCDTRAAAVKWAEEFFGERAGRRVPGAGQDVDFHTAAQHYKAWRNPSKAETILVDRVARHFGKTLCRTLVHANLVAAAHALLPGRKDTTKTRKVIKPAAAVLHYAAEQKWCAYQRFKSFPESRISNREPATVDTMAQLLEHLEDPIEELAPQWKDSGVDPNLPYKRLLIVMLYELGLRISDYLAIDWDQVDLLARRVRVKIAKTDRIASLEISTVVVAELANLPRKTGPLFPWSTRNAVYAWLKRVRKRAGVHYTPHLSRHALATDAGDRGLPDKRAAELGAWADPRSLQRYQHLRPDAIPGRDAGAILTPKKATR